MSRNLYKLIQNLEKRVEDLEAENMRLRTKISILEINHVAPRPQEPIRPISPWYVNEPTFTPPDPYKIWCRILK